MPSLLAYRPIRLLCDLANPNYVRDQRTGLPPVIARGSPTAIQVALAIDRAVCSTPGSIAAAITLEVRASADPALTPLISQTIAAVDFNDALTQTQWDAKTAQHATFLLSALDTAVAAGERWLSVTFAPTTGPSVVAAFGTLNVREDGTGGTPDDGDLFYTDEELLARYLPLAADGEGMKRGSEAIEAGAVLVPVVFATPFADVPAVVRVWGIKPDADGANFFATVRKDLITAEGFTAELSGPLPAEHELGWLACL